MPTLNCFERFLQTVREPGVVLAGPAAEPAPFPEGGAVSDAIDATYGFSVKQNLSVSGGVCALQVGCFVCVWHRGIITACFVFATSKKGEGRRCQEI